MSCASGATAGMLGNARDLPIRADRSASDAERNACLENRLTLCGWLGGAGILLALAAPPLAGCLYVCDDLGAFHLPLRSFYAQQLAARQPFDWMPQLYAGFYLTGEGQAGTYHPLHFALYRLLPLSAAFSVELLLSYPLMFVGMVLFLEQRVRQRSAAALGALAFTFGSFNLLHFVHPNAIAIVAHIPWLLWAIDVVFRPSRPWQSNAALVLIALLVGSQILLGYPQYVWFSLLAVAALTIYLTFERRVGPHVPTAGTADGLRPPTH
ncbi:MAG: hypothetical protein ACOY3P_11490, partial [Planctomycetota bacterium]